jgi:hypothetical protein
MSPKDKARELVNDYYVLFSVTLENTISEYEAARCALLDVKNTIEALRFHSWQNRNEINWWLDVKDEIKEYE